MHQYNYILVSELEETVTSDASTIGWGCEFQGTRTGGAWLPAESQFHINYLELKAAFFALQCFQTKLVVRLSGCGLTIPLRRLRLTVGAQVVLVLDLSLTNTVCYHISSICCSAYLELDRISLVHPFLIIQAAAELAHSCAISHYCTSSRLHLGKTRRVFRPNSRMCAHTYAVLK